MKEISNKNLLIFLISSVILALAGILLLRLAGSPWGEFLLLAGGVSFCLACADLSVRNPLIDETGGSRFKRSLSAAVVGIFFVTAAALFSLKGTESLLHGLEVVLLWLLGVVLFSIGILYAVEWKPIRLSELSRMIRENVKAILAISGLVAAALLIRTIGLTSHPYAVANDAGSIAFDAVHLFRGEFTNFFGTGWSAFPILSQVPLGLSTLIFGKTVFAMRVVSTIEGALSILFLYLLCRELFSRRVAWIAALLLAVLPVQIHYSREGLNNILMCLHVTLIFWLLVRAVRNGRGSSYLWAGLAIGSALYAYSGSWLVMALAGGMLIALILFKRGYWRHNWQNVLIVCGAVFVVTLPQFAYYFQHPGLFFARSNAVGIFTGGWIYQEAIRTGETVRQVFLSQLVKPTLVFISISETNGFYEASKPFFSVVESVFLVLGMGYAIFRIKHPVYMLLFCWFWSVIIFGGAMTIPQPASQRLIIAFPAAAILIADAMDHSAVLLQNAVHIPSRMLNLLGSVLIVAIAVNHLVYYFHDYRINGYYNRAFEEIQYESIDIERQLGKEYRYVLLGAPRLFLEFGDYRYFLDGYDRSEVPEGQDILGAILEQKGQDTQSGAESVNLTNTPARPTFYVAIPERKSELYQVEQLYPGGKWIVEGRRYKPGETLFYGYIVPGREVNINRTIDSAVENVIPWSTILLISFYLLAALVLKYFLYPKIFRGRAEAVYAGRRKHRAAVSAWFARTWKYLLSEDIEKKE